MKPNKRRLLKLARFLEALPRRKFDFGVWVGEKWKGKPDLSCGTKACALGWACAIPSFRKLGASIGRPINHWGDVGDVGDPSPLWKGKDNGADYVSEKLFGLTTAQHMRLFQPGGCGRGYSGLDASASPREVAANIRAFVKEIKTNVATR